MALRVSEVFGPMLAAAKESLSADWPKVKDFAKPELKQLAQSLVNITRLLANGKVNKQQARALLQIHKNTTAMVFLAIEGLGIIAVENAINAALEAVGDVVNSAAGIKML